MKKEESFENNMKHLEEIVCELEKGELSLEDSVKKFEEGIKVSKKCNELLENAEKRITIILNDNDNIEEKEFKAEE